jgi:hypothetical protein
MEKFNNTHYVKLYRLMCEQGMSLEKAAKCLGLSAPALNRQLLDDEALQDVLAHASQKKALTKTGGDSNYFNKWVVGHLHTQHAQQAWEEICVAWEETRKNRKSLGRRYSPTGQLVAIVDPLSDADKKALFLHALYDTGYDISAALRMTHIPRYVMQSWMADPKFVSIVEELRNSRQDEVEGALMQLVREGDRGAVIFASKTINRGRGYGDKVQVEHSRGIQLGLEDLDLPIEVLEQIEQAIERKRLQSEAIDTEVVQ